MSTTKKYLDEEGLSILVTNIKKHINAVINGKIDTIDTATIPDYFFLELEDYAYKNFEIEPVEED